MRSILKLVLVTTCLFTASNVPVLAYRADEIMQYCGGQQELEFFCIGYVFGVVQHSTSLQSSGLVPDLFCLPQSYAPEQLAAVFQKHYHDHPEQWTLPGTEVVVNAMMSAFPCS